MLRPGCIIAFDDVNRPAIRKVCRFVVLNRHYSVAVAVDPTPGRPSILQEALVEVGRHHDQAERLLRPEILHPDDELGLTGP